MNFFFLQSVNVLRKIIYLMLAIEMWPIVRNLYPGEIRFVFLLFNVDLVGRASYTQATLGHWIDQEGRKEGNVLFNDALNTFYSQLYGVRHMVKYHSDSEKGNPLPQHRLLFPSKGSFICTIPQTG